MDLTSQREADALYSLADETRSLISGGDGTYVSAAVHSAVEAVARGFEQQATFLSPLRSCRYCHAFPGKHTAGCIRNGVAIR